MRAKQSRKLTSQPRRTASKRINYAALNHQRQRLRTLAQGVADRLTNLKDEKGRK